MCPVQNVTYVSGRSIDFKTDFLPQTIRSSPLINGDLYAQFVASTITEAHTIHKKIGLAVIAEAAYVSTVKARIKDFTETESNQVALAH